MIETIGNIVLVALIVVLGAISFRLWFGPVIERKKHTFNPKPTTNEDIETELEKEFEKE